MKSDEINKVKFCGGSADGVVFSKEDKSLDGFKRFKTSTYSIGGSNYIYKDFSDNILTLKHVLNS